MGIKYHFCLLPSALASYTLSLHDALPICGERSSRQARRSSRSTRPHVDLEELLRSEEHTSELQSQSKLVCRLLLEKKTPHKQRRNPSEVWSITSDQAHLYLYVEGTTPQN